MAGYRCGSWLRMSSRVHSVNVSSGGVPKLPVAGAMVTTSGVEGDRQRNKRFHGGPRRAVCLYSLDLITELNREGHPIVPGGVGENITVSGLEWSQVVPGVVLTIGAAELEITSYTEPCAHIRKSFMDNQIARIAQGENPGWSRVYASVRRAGWVRVGDAVTLRKPEQTTFELR